MPEEQKKEPMVDIDTSGPEVEVNLEEQKKVEEPKETIQVEEISEKETDKTFENERETKLEEAKPKEETEEKKKELEEYSEGVQKRIAKLTKKWREAERQKEAALEWAKKVKVEQESLQTKLKTIEPNYVTAMEGRVTSGLQAAQAALSRAREAGDIAAEVEAQKMIAKLGVEEARVANLKKQAETKSKETVSTPTLDQAIAPKKQAPDPKAEEWAEKNPWFGTDNAMTYTAFDLHKKLTEEEGFDAQSDEYYAEIDKRMRLDFPHKFGTNDSTVTTKPTQTVASAKRSVNPSRKTVRLTPSQVTIAKKLGVPLEEYAKQLNITKEA
jgi:GH15 family glucan-1,4-alpha-glucosidase